MIYSNNRYKDRSGMTRAQKTRALNDLTDRGFSIKESARIIISGNYKPPTKTVKEVEKNRDISKVEKKKTKNDNEDIYTQFDNGLLQASKLLDELKQTIASNKKKEVKEVKENGPASSMDIEKYVGVGVGLMFLSTILSVFKR